jgi:hypothetical protein
MGRGVRGAVGSGAVTVDGLLLRGKVHGQTGDLDRCLADVDEAIRRNPTNAIAVGARGDVHLAKDYDRVLKPIGRWPVSTSAML